MMNFRIAHTKCKKQILRGPFATIVMSTLQHMFKSLYSVVSIQFLKRNSTLPTHFPEFCSSAILSKNQIYLKIEI